MTRLRLITTVVTAVVAGLLPTNIAGAAAPDVVVYHEYSSDTYPAGSLCPFDVHIEIAEVARVTTFFDNSGLATAVRTHVTGGSVSTNVATGAQLDGKWAFDLTENLADGSAVLTGRRIAFSDGRGILRMEAGRQVWDSYVQTGHIVFQAGRNDAPFTVAEFCAALT